MVLILFLFIGQVAAGRVGGSNLTTCGCPARFHPTSITIPPSYDLRTVFPNSMSPIRNQGECGCCWAFSTTSALADRFSIAAAKLNRTIRRLLSPQTLLDCSTGCLSGGQCNMGCNGGYNSLAIAYFNSTGIVGENCRPYQAKQSTCPAAPCAAGVTSQLYHSTLCYSLETVEDIQREILTHGPVVAGLQIHQGFESYTGGIFTVTSSVTKGGHAVRLIGWGEENGVAYWHAANQWTTWWGEKGFFRIRRGTNEATIESFVIAMEPIMNLLTADENVDYMSTCADCVTQRQLPNSDPINALIDTGVTWPGGLNDTSAISLIVLSCCALLGCLASVYYCMKPRRRQKKRQENEDLELQQAIALSKREQRSPSAAAPVAVPSAAVRDPDLELAIALSKNPENQVVAPVPSYVPQAIPVAVPQAIFAPPRISNAQPPAYPPAVRYSVGAPPPYDMEGPQAARIRAASRTPQVDDIKQVAPPQQGAARRVTREEADLQLALQLSKADAAPPRRQEDADLAYALALSRGDRLDGIEG